MKIIFETCLTILVIGCFWRAATEDFQTCQVRRFWWWIAGGTGMILMILRRGIMPGAVAELAIFGAIQFLLFSRAYGRADCHAFFCGAIALAAFGGGLKEFLWHELITFALLGAIQIHKKNVNKKGNLKRPVPLIPYVLPSLFLTFFLMDWKRCLDIAIF